MNSAQNKNPGSKSKRKISQPKKVRQSFNKESQEDHSMTNKRTKPAKPPKKRKPRGSANAKEKDRPEDSSISTEMPQTRKDEKGHNCPICNKGFKQYG